MGQLFPESFAAHFGKFGSFLLEDLLRRRVSCGTIEKGKSIMSRSTSIDDVIRRLREYLDFPDVPHQ